MTWAGQGGGCLAWLFWEEGTGLATGPFKGPHLLGWGSAKPGLACLPSCWPAQLPACGCGETWSLAGRLSV